MWIACDRSDRLWTGPGNRRRGPREPTDTSVRTVRRAPSTRRADRLDTGDPLLSRADHHHHGVATRIRLGRNYVSNLGVAGSCARNGSWVCSPSMLFFNGSIVVVGGAMALGALLLYVEFRGNRGALAGFSCLAVSGVGTILVGTVPSNTIGFLHHLGAGLAFIGGAVGVVLLGFVLRAEPVSVRYFSFGSVVVAVAGMALLLLFYGSGIDYKGAAERLASYPLIIWFVGIGSYLGVRSGPSTRWGAMGSRRRCCGPS